MRTSSLLCSATIWRIAASMDFSEDTSSSMGRKSTLLSCANFFTSATCGALGPAVSHIEAYTVWPAFARALADRRPKPLEAPVITITFFMTGFSFTYLVSRVSLQGSELQSVDKAAVGAHNLAVDPAPLRTSE